MAEPRVTVGERDIRSVYNGTGGDLAKGTIVEYKTSGVQDEIIASVSAGGPFLGVLSDALSDATWGNCQIHGKALALSLGAVTKGNRVTWGTGAKVTTAAATNVVLGVAASTASGADELFEIELAGPGGQVMA
jgi:hypothetical protein